MNLMFASDNVVWASWRFKAEEQPHSLRHTNEVGAAYVARGGGMRLYAYLYKLGEGAIYCDTVLYLYRSRTNSP